MTIEQTETTAPPALTREQVMAAQGRELDAMAAVQFCGWRWYLLPLKLADGNIYPRVYLFHPSMPEFEYYKAGPGTTDITDTGTHDQYERGNNWDNISGQFTFLRFREDHNAAALVQKDVGRRGLDQKFQTELYLLLNPSGLAEPREDFGTNPLWKWDWDVVADMMEATPEQKVRAALLAVVEGE